MENKHNDMRAMAVERAASMRQQALATAEKRKQEYLGARVPKELREKILLKAEAMRIPVSILIRNILSEYIDNQNADVAPVTVTAQENVAHAKRSFDDVIGWDQLTLNKEMVCEGCMQQMSKGSEVAYGIVPGKSHVIICKKCKSIDGSD